MMTTLRNAIILSVLLVLAGGPVLAAGGSSGSAPKDENYTKAEQHIVAGEYGDAIPLLEKVIAANDKNADAFNYLGYSHRQLGQFDAAMAHYQTALRLDPEHRGANEYLGEMYLQLGELEKAEERLEVLDKACFFGCEEYSELKKAIADYKARQGQS